MNTTPKVILSVLGSFILGVTGAYKSGVANDWIAILFAGLAPVGTYFLGFSQYNPAISRPGEVTTTTTITPPSPPPKES